MIAQNEMDKVGGKMKYLIFKLLIVSLICNALTVNLCAEQKTNKNKRPQYTQKDIEQIANKAKILKYGRSDMSNGLQVVLLVPKSINIEGLKMLGQYFCQKYKHESIVQVDLWDDETYYNKYDILLKKEELLDDSKVPEYEFKNIMKHERAIYNKNLLPANMFTIFLKEDKTIDIKY